MQNLTPLVDTLAAGHDFGVPDSPGGFQLPDYDNQVCAEA